MSLIQYPPKSCPEPGESAETASLALPQPLNHPRAAGTRRGQRARGPGKGGRAVCFSEERGKRFPATSSLRSGARAAPARSDDAEPQPPPRTECSPLVTHPPPPRPRRGQKCKTPWRNLGALPRDIAEGATWCAFREPRLHAPNPGESPGLSPRPGEPAAWLRGSAPGWSCAGCKRARCCCCFPGSFPPHSQSSARLTFTESTGYMMECSRIPAIAPAVMWVDTEALVGRFS